MTQYGFALLALCGALAAPLLSTVPAFAQPAPDAGALARHRELFDKGNQLYELGKLQEAEVAYLEAWRLKNTYDVAGNLGNVELDLGKARAAAEHLAYAILEFPAGGKAAARDTMERRLEEARQHVGLVRVGVNRAGAEISIDGAPLGVSPLMREVYVEPGAHIFEARFDGYPPARVTVSVNRGTQRDVTLELRPKAPNHAVLAAGGAIAGASVAAGVVLTILASSRASAASQQRDALARSGGCGLVAAASSASSQCRDLQGAIRDRASFGNAALWSFVGGGIVGAGTAVYGLAAPRLSKTGVRILPIVTADGPGFVMGGAF